MPAWRIYYADGSTADDKTPRDRVPRWGAICAVYHENTTGQCVASDGDYIVLRKSTGRWTSHNLLGLHQLIAKHLDDLDLVVLCLCVDDETYMSIKHRATIDPDFPPNPRQVNA